MAIQSTLPEDNNQDENNKNLGSSNNNDIPEIINSADIPLNAEVHADSEQLEQEEQPADNDSVEINTTSNNQGGKYNKKQLMAMTKEERAAIIFKDMQSNIDKENDPEYNLNINQTKLMEQSRNARSYMALPTNKAYHLEIVKRTFNKNTPITNVDDLELSFAEYFKLCYKHKKIPTIEALCLYAGISVYGFQLYCKDPQNLFFDSCVKAKSVIHEITQQAAIEGHLAPQIYTLMAKNYWGFVTNSDANVLIVNNNSDTSAKQKLELLDALEQSQREFGE